MRANQVENMWMKRSLLNKVSNLEDKVTKLTNLRQPALDSIALLLFVDILVEFDKSESNDETSRLI